MTSETELHATLSRVGKALDVLGVPWAIGGSFASTVYGEPLATNDADIIASLRLPHVEPLVESLGTHFCADPLSIRNAVLARQSFNLIDERSFLKVDELVPPPGPLGEGQLVRRKRYSLGVVGPHVPVLGPEDIVLQKLRWHRVGGGV